MVWAEAYLRTKWHLIHPAVQLFGHNRHALKIGGCVPLGEGELGPHQTQHGQENLILCCEPNKPPPPSAPCGHHWRPVAASVAAVTWIRPELPMHQKTGRPQVPVMLPPWLYASHNCTKHECGSFIQLMSHADTACQLNILSLTLGYNNYYYYYIRLTAFFPGQPG